MITMRRVFFFPVKSPLPFISLTLPVQNDKDTSDDDEQEERVHDRDGNIAGNPERVLADPGMGACIVHIGNVRIVRTDPLMPASKIIINYNQIAVSCLCRTPEFLS
jgi:hypothetical protein